MCIRASLREVEKARLDARRELQELRRQAKMLEADRAKLNGDVQELLQRVAKDEEREEDLRRENYAIKQKVGISRHKRR